MAVPAFSKKYEAPCSMCHSAWPRLNAVGGKFKMNGYQLPDSEDGGEKGKFSPVDSLFLDIGDANPPLSFRLNGGMILQQPDEGPEGERSGGFFCCVEGNTFTASLGGTVAPNIGYWLSLPWGDEDVEQGYLRFVNWFKPGLVSLDVGVMEATDYDAVPAGRSWFGAPKLAHHGHPYNDNATPLGYSAAGSDMGIRIYGRPSYGLFSYEIAAYTGAGLTGTDEDDAEKAYTFMGRMDLDKVAVSLRYWGNKSGKLDMTAAAPSGESLTFEPDPLDPNEDLQEFILTARYSHPYFEVDLALERSTMTVGGRTIRDADGAVSHTFSRDAIHRNAASLGVIWLINNWMRTGAAYGFSYYEDYAVTVDGEKTEMKSANVGMFQWRFEIMPVSNMRIGLELHVDSSESDARIGPDGSTFVPQNKLLLQWDLAL